MYGRADPLTQFVTRSGLVTIGLRRLGQTGLSAESAGALYLREPERDYPRVGVMGTPPSRTMWGRHHVE